MKISARKIAVLFLLVTLSVASFSFTSTAFAQNYSGYSWCNVSVITSPQNGGTVTPGSGSYYYGDYVVFMEYTNTGYIFDGWYLNEVYQGQLSSIPVTITQDFQLLAAFSKRVVDLTITANPSGGGTIAPGTGVYNYTCGDSVTVTEFTNSGYTFSGWYLDGTYEGLGSGITVTMNQDNQLNAFFSGGENNLVPTPAPTATPAPLPTPNPNLPTPILQFYCTSSTTYTGFNVKIQGALEYNGVGLPNEGILFSYSVTGGATWQELAYVNTGDDGGFSAVWMPSASGDYAIRGVWLGDDTYSYATKAVNFAVSPDDQDQNVFSVASNSTLSSLTFDSTKSQLSFTVSGPSGTTGYVQACIPKSLLSDISTLKVTLDDSTTPYTYVSSDNVWIIIFVYHHSSHQVVMALNGPASHPSSSSSGLGSLGNVLGSPLILVAIIAVLVAVIAVLIIINRRKNRTDKST